MGRVDCCCLRMLICPDNAAILACSFESSSMMLWLVHIRARVYKMLSKMFKSKKSSQTRGCPRFKRILRKVEVLCNRAASFGRCRYRHQTREDCPLINTASSHLPSNNSSVQI